MYKIAEMWYESDPVTLGYTLAKAVKNSINVSVNSGSAISDVYIKTIFTVNDPTTLFSNTGINLTCTQQFLSAICTFESSVISANGIASYMVVG